MNEPIFTVLAGVNGAGKTSLYNVKSKDGYSGLITYPPEEESVDGCRKAIDRANRQAQEKGYAPQQYVIVRTVWNRICFPDGTFKESHDTTSFVELYPQTL